jgi:hypothetical protein
MNLCYVWLDLARTRSWSLVLCEVVLEIQGDRQFPHLSLLFELCWMCVCSRAGYISGVLSDLTGVGVHGTKVPFIDARVIHLSSSIPANNHESKVSYAVHEEVWHLHRS